MPTRKQRRRRQKELRHEYEYVYVDGEGNVVGTDDADEAGAGASKRGARKNGKGDPARAKAAAGKRPARKIDPPSWTRVLKRAGIFAPLIFVALGLFNHETLPARIALTAAYTAFFIPFMYLMDRAMYRSYLRRTGNPPGRRSWRRP
jgi:hypothetical protein